MVHASLGYEQSKLIASYSSLASIQHVGVRPIVPPGEVSWKQPCSLTGVPLHDDDDDDRWFSTPRVLWTVRHSTGKVTENQQEDCSSQSEVMIRFVGPSSFTGDRRRQKSSSASVIGDRSTPPLQQHTGVCEHYDDRHRNTSLTVGVVRRMKTTKLWEFAACILILSLAKLAFSDIIVYRASQ